MAITHATIKSPGDKLYANEDWNAEHVGTAQPDPHELSGGEHLGRLDATQLPDGGTWTLDGTLDIGPNLLFLDPVNSEVTFNANNTSCNITLYGRIKFYPNDWNSFIISRSVGDCNVIIDTSGNVDGRASLTLETWAGSIWNLQTEAGFGKTGFKIVYGGINGSPVIYLKGSDKLVSINSLDPEFRLTLDKGYDSPDGGILSIGTFGSGNTLITSGSGTRLIWYPRKASFRAGYVSNDEWDDSNIGNYSVAFCYSNCVRSDCSACFGSTNTIDTDSSCAFICGDSNFITGTSFSSAIFGSSNEIHENGYCSFISGSANTISNHYSSAFGFGNFVDGVYSFASGLSNTSGSISSTSLGTDNFSLGESSASIGYSNHSLGSYSIALGSHNSSESSSSVTLGSYNTATGNSSVCVGSYNSSEGNSSFASGVNSIASGDYSFASGIESVSQSYCSSVFGRYNVYSGNSSEWIETDPLFVVGNGSSSTSRSNALTILKNGSTGIKTSSPNSTLNVNGTISVAVTIVSSSTALDDSYTLYACDCSSGSITLTLPLSSLCAGREYIIKKIDSSSNSVTINTIGGDTIDASSSYTLSSQYKYVRLIAIGGIWLVVGSG